MILRRFNHTVMIRRLPLLLLVIAILAPSTMLQAAPLVEVVVEDPQLQPAYTTCKDSYWYPFASNRGHTAYLTLNVSDPSNSTNSGEWHPVIPQAGYYQVEAYVAGHSPITWCTGSGWIINHDTTEAHYSIHHAYGVSNQVQSQYPHSNTWINLGEYYFSAGSSGFVSLSDLNAEAEYTTTVSFSAMRFTFTRPTRPQTYLPLVYYTDPSGRPPADVGVIQAQGFDACHLPTIAEMQTWRNTSPYSFYALYIGGIHLPSFCARADAAWVKAVHQQGWSFMPTWVGPQAPCTEYKYRMSSDPVVSYIEGRQEADAASAAAAAIRLTNYGWGGTIIYYDLEPYGVSSPECRQPVASFINGWSERLDELGNLSGGYGSRNSYLADWATIANAPDDAWPASWYTNNYDPYATVFGITWLEGLWTNHQRIRQYAGGHNETWGGITFNIDTDVADGMVAMPPAKSLANPIVTKSLSIEDVGWLSAQQGWLVSGNRLYWTNDRGEAWDDISPAVVQLAYLLPGGQAWALSTSTEELVALYHSSNLGGSWESLEIPLPPGSWWPLQLQFSSASSGWMVMQKETGQTFSTAILMKTSDGGLTWQTFDLPAASKIVFTSSTEGWLQDNLSSELYRTADGGISWQVAPTAKYPFSQPQLPAGAAISGWQAGDLGWSVTSQGVCSRDKFVSGSTCQVNTVLWQTLDGGKNWESIPIPNLELIKP